MAYISYDTTHARPKARSAPRVRLTPPLAWGRLMAVAASLFAWVGIIAAVRAVF